MKTILSLFFVSLIAISSFGAEKSTKQIVILDNENLVEGIIEKTDLGYSINTVDKGSFTLPQSRVLAVVGDRKQAYEFVIKRSDRRDADERLRISRWCVANNLLDEALFEAQSASKMRVNFRAAEAMINTVQSLAKARDLEKTSNIQRVKAESPATETVKEIATPEYNTESFALYSSKVNSILVNLCAGCHNRDDVKGFKLTNNVGRTSAKQNLLTTIPYLKGNETHSSILLSKALTAHGKLSDPPIKNRNHPAFQVLEYWVNLAKAPEGTTEVDPATFQLVGEPKKLPNLDQAEPIFGGKNKAETKSGSGEVFGQDSKTDPSRSGKDTGADPFDPAIFNSKSLPKKQ